MMYSSVKWEKGSTTVTVDADTASVSFSCGTVERAQEVYAKLMEDECVTVDIAKGDWRKVLL